jgi:hypothetical protein
LSFSENRLMLPKNSSSQTDWLTKIKIQTRRAERNGKETRTARILKKNLLFFEIINSANKKDARERASVLFFWGEFGD